MNDIDLILDDCLTQITSGESSLDECLTRHPEYAARLAPLLKTAARVERGRQVKLLPATKSRTRARLYAHMEAHPRRSAWVLPPVWRVAASLAVLVMVFLVIGTAFAQSALPGQPLYAWKLSSEQVWRIFSPDSVGVDLSLADRRVDEMTVIAEDPARKAQALNGYLEALARLKSESAAGNDERILPALESHREKLSAAGISVPELDHIISPSGANPVPPHVIPVPSPLPKVIPPVVPDIVPPVRIPVLKP